MTATRGRRAFLVTTATTAAAIAGCGRPADDAAATESDGGTDASGRSGTTDVRTETNEPSPSDLDLREANVVDVDVETVGEARYRFDVTLIHDDDGEDGYANWWQVESLDGTRLGRRELAHAHGTQEFTRSAEVDVPAGLSCVVVRGHDQTHEYGGRAMLVNVDSGAVEPADQESERATFTADDCP